MTNYELYINGILCDLPADEAITLRYQSPIFSGLDVIQSNRSYEISLPLTSRNRRAIGFAERLDVEANEPYERLSAALYQDGVPLFTTGYAVITEISDVINVVLTWGNVDNFQPLFDAGLQDLGEQLGSYNHIDWNEETKIIFPGEPYPAVAFWGIDFGMGLSEPKFMHPSVTVMALLDAIEKYNGITIEGKERLMQSPTLPLIVPLVTKKGDHKGLEAYVVDGGTGYLVPGQIRSDPNNWAGSNGIFARTGNNDESGSLHVSFRYFSVNMPSQTADKLSISIIYGDFNSTGGISESTTKHVMDSSRKVGATYYFDDTSVDYEMCQFLEIVVSPYAYSTGTGGVTISGIINVWQDSDDYNPAVFPDKFPVAKNLPDMTQGDFVLALMSMYGLFAYADKDSPNTIKLISIEDIYASQAKTIDWSHKVLLNDGHDVSRPDSSVFTLADFAQRNLIDYDNDDDVRSDTHGLITVRNENIEKETDLAELPFSASENTVTDGVSCALVPLYEKKDNADGEANYTSCNPRILAGHRGSTYNGEGICTGRFDPWMKFGGEEGLIAQYYSAYQKVVDRIRLITLRAKLTALDLMELDYTKPVYISQFGHTFALYSVETSEDGICDCEFVLLRNFQPVINPVPDPGTGPNPDPDPGPDPEPAYYLRIDGEEDRVSRTVVGASVVQLNYQTNGTLRVTATTSDMFEDIAYSGGVLTFTVKANPEETYRLGILRATLEEDPTKSVYIDIFQRPLPTVDPLEPFNPIKKIL